MRDGYERDPPRLWQAEVVVHSENSRKCNTPSPHSVSCLRLVYQTREKKVSRGRPYSPLEKVLEQRFELDNRNAWKVYRVRFGSPLHNLAICTRKREHGAKEWGVYAKKVLGDTEKVALDLHTLREDKGRGIKKAALRRISDGPESMASRGHEPGRPPFRLSSNTYVGEGLVRETHHPCQPSRPWAKESLVPTQSERSDDGPHYG